MKQTMICSNGNLKTIFSGESQPWGSDSTRLKQKSPHEKYSVHYFPVSLSFSHQWLFIFLRAAIHCTSIITDDGFVIKVESV